MIDFFVNTFAMMLFILFVTVVCKIMGNLPPPWGNRGWTNRGRR